MATSDPDCNTAGAKSALIDQTIVADEAGRASVAFEVPQAAGMRLSIRAYAGGRVSPL